MRALKGLIWLSLTLPSCLSLTTSRNGHLQCEFYDKQCIDDANNNGEKSEEILKKCSGIKTCESDDSVCYTTWDANERNLTDLIKEGRRHVHKMGCISNQDSKCNIRQCLHTKAKPVSGNILFCCCTGNLCNAKFEWVPEEHKDIIPKADHPPIEKKSGQSNTVIIVLIILVIAFVVVITLGVAYKLKQQKAETFEAIPTEDPNGLGKSGDLELITNLKLQDTQIELHNTIGTGKYGQVYRGKMKDEWVAVKIFALNGKGSYETETNIFALPLMNNHENILKCLGVDQRKGQSLEAEFWLVTEYHAKGSLHDFLRNNTLSWDQLCTIALNIANGLAFLHDDKQCGDKRKHAITHRDFKSKNVLIKSDLTACISDFGLAHVFKPGQETDTFGQVGTLRYMAPEVLEGAIHFSRDSFLRIDMYACGLVLWELATRCRLGQSSSAEEYKLPYEAETNNPNTSLEEMQDLMNRRIRPVIKDSWKLNVQGMPEFCETIEHCWDHDADARLSASCVAERIKYCIKIASNVPDSGVGSTASTINGDTDNNSSVDDDTETTNSINPDNAELIPLVETTRPGTAKLLQQH